MRNGASCPTISMAPVLAITGLVARTSMERPCDPVGEFLNWYPYRDRRKCCWRGALAVDRIT
jgi:hypothetical protein